MGDIGSMTTSDCPRCSPTITLDLSQGQRVLEHIGSHIIDDPAVIQSSHCVACASVHRSFASSIWQKEGARTGT